MDKTYQDGRKNVPVSETTLVLKHQAKERRRDPSSPLLQTDNLTYYRSEAFARA